VEGAAVKTETIYSAMNLAHWRSFSSSIYPRAERQYKKFYTAFHARIEAGDRAREALKDLEWTFDERWGITCPWCDGNKYHGGHTPDCPRQLALGISNVTE
jgi:hypothetical protein